MDKDNRWEKEEKKKEEEDLIGNVNVVATCCTGFVQIMHFFYFSFQFLYRSCKDQIWRESKTGMDPGPRNPNNEFIECRKES